MWKAFKEFINRGNVMDLAVAAFTQVVNSLVGDIITPVIGAGLGGLDFIKNLSITIGGATIKYGAFIQAIINFLIVAFAMFLIVQAYNKFKKKEEKKEEVKKQTEPSQEVVLLTQIRDIMQRNSGVVPGGQPAPNQPQPSGETGR
jgi:large conductance mechanosensitive channel